MIHRNDDNTDNCTGLPKTQLLPLLKLKHTASTINPLLLGDTTDLNITKTHKCTQLYSLLRTQSFVPNQNLLKLLSVSGENLRFLAEAVDFVANSSKSRVLSITLKQLMQHTPGLRRQGH